MAVELDEHRRAIEGAPLDEITDKVGLMKEHIAQKFFELTNAKTTKLTKQKGWIDKRFKLPVGFKIVKGTDEETLIQSEHNNNSTQLGAVKEAIDVKALKPAKDINLHHDEAGIMGQMV